VLAVELQYNKNAKESTSEQRKKIPDGNLNPQNKMREAEATLLKTYLCRFKYMKIT
jgi:hypothetical protein